MSPSIPALSASSTPRTAGVSRASANALPPELLGQIFAQLSAEDWDSASSVSQRWRRIAEQPAVTRAVVAGAGLRSAPAALEPSAPELVALATLRGVVRLTRRLRVGPLAIEPGQFAPSDVGFPSYPDANRELWQNGGLLVRPRKGLPPMPFANGRHVLIGRSQGGVAALDLAQPHAPSFVLFDQAVQTWCLSPSQRWLAVVRQADDASELHFVDLARPVPSPERCLQDGGFGGVRIFSHRYRDDLFVINSRDCLYRTSLDDRKLNFWARLASRPAFFEFADDGRFVAFSDSRRGLGRRIQVVDLEVQHRIILTTPFADRPGYPSLFGFFRDRTCFRLFAVMEDRVKVSAASGILAEPWIDLSAVFVNEPLGRCECVLPPTVGGPRPGSVRILPHRLLFLTTRTFLLR